MEIIDKDIKRISILILLLVFAILIFILVKPIILSIIGGLILAYTFFPIYKFILKKIKNKNLAATLVSLFALILIILPLYFLIPFLINQIFELFTTFKALSIQGFIKTVFPQAPESFIIQMIVTFDSLISKVSSAVLNVLVNFLLEVPTILFNLTIVAFVFFFALRDADKLGEFVSSLSPINKVQEKKLVQQFKDITNSIVYGQFVIGIVQGILASLGFFVFGIPKPLVLSVLVLIFSILPILGPFFVWIPATIYLFTQGNSIAGAIFLLYNLIVVSNIDNLLRLYLVSKKTNLAQVVVLIGMIGGLFIFGILGLIIGPLLLAYFITFLHAYRENTLSSMFKIEKEPNV